jgi:hypothetical protein
LAFTDARRGASSSSCGVAGKLIAESPRVPLRADSDWHRMAPRGRWDHSRKLDAAGAASGQYGALMPWCW